MLPYWFSAMTMKSVGSAALKIVEKVRRQFNTIPVLMEGDIISLFQYKIGIYTLLAKRRSRGDRGRGSTGSTAASTSTSMRVHGRGGDRGGRGRDTPSTSSVELLVCVRI
ncbi:hypothetical protein MKW98_015545 [Papaver atlanticum]|uniref:H(+)-exporting diphosphatase n=1 Tax=Papaver atlanticum TaxID=357466 RepID=A0AAD4S4F7_9MAGN|nr:hypothetical protein MKW98_015545 [Papaver atlanticum]